MPRSFAVSFSLEIKGLDDSNVCITLSLLSTFLRPIVYALLKYKFNLLYNLAKMKIDLLKIKALC
jgi:hypothetical protein